MNNIYGRVDQKFETAMRYGGLTPEARKRARARERERRAEAKALAQVRAEERQIARRLQKYVAEPGRAAVLQRDFLEEARKKEREERQKAARIAEAAFVQLVKERAIPDAVVDIIRLIAEHNRVTPFDVIGPRLARSVCQARAAAVYAIRSTGSSALARSYPKIGQWFGRDHTTMLYAAKVHATRHGLPDITGLSSKAVDRKRQRPEQRTSFGA